MFFDSVIVCFLLKSSLLVCSFFRSAGSRSVFVLVGALRCHDSVSVKERSLLHPKDFSARALESVTLHPADSPILLLIKGGHYDKQASTY